ncbi:MAG TPA: tyrosine-type recombinase/integrase [Noviherbaspirillum sp.]|uniref:tyrosine-type recombinase/integrase n=1 Tax=Noviherbaspirillum sp. TaxID=1926288 RepID=UPI002DDDA0B7|nr:tyrosine-type recombinase/integrase [Noviherbaspirillum sp.]HEV2612496.1 tyrosine-type recombinase/integrase [Noviherbaspirillum sp.]
MPPHMRRRAQKSGKVYYYFDTGEKPRREIPLGDDYIAALQKYAELRRNVEVAATVFGDVIDRYVRDVLPTLARNTIKTHTSDMKHIRFSFSTAPIDQIRPMHIQAFLEDHRDKPTTANRCKRLFSTLWNHARGWGYTDEPNPCTGIMGHSIEKKTAYVTDTVFNAVRDCASDALKDALDLAYLTGQRPADTLKMRGSDIANGFLEISQGKTKKRLRISITGALAELLGRIAVRKAQHKIIHDQLLMNRDGKPFTQPALRSHFDAARKAAKLKHPKLAAQIDNFKFRDLRAKAADDTSDQRGQQAASDLLGHDNVKTTQRHYLRRGKIVEPTK